MFGSGLLSQAARVSDVPRLGIRDRLEDLQLVALGIEKVGRGTPLGAMDPGHIDAGGAQPLDLDLDALDLERDHDAVAARIGEAPTSSKGRMVEELDRPTLTGELHPVDAWTVARAGIDFRHIEPEHVSIEGEHGREVLDVEQQEPESHTCCND